MPTFNRPYRLIHVLIKLLSFLLLKFSLTSSSPTHRSLAYILCARKEQQGSGGWRVWEIEPARNFAGSVSKVLAYMSENGWYFTTGNLGIKIWGFCGCFLWLVHLFEVSNFSIISVVLLSQSTFACCLNP